jgi:CheY-like chemotaxis protein
MRPNHLSAMRVLLVDDEIQPLELRAHIMKLRGFFVLAVDSPLRAIAMAKQPVRTIDVAVLDYDMPVMNGGTLAGRLRSILPELRIVLYSGALDVPQSELSNVDAFVSKGDGIETLIDQVLRFAQTGVETPRRLSSKSMPPLSRTRSNHRDLLLRRPTKKFG